MAEIGRMTPVFLTVAQFHRNFDGASFQPSRVLSTAIVGIVVAVGFPITYQTWNFIKMMNRLPGCLLSEKTKVENRT